MLFSGPYIMFGGFGELQQPVRQCVEIHTKRLHVDRHRAIGGDDIEHAFPRLCAYGLGKRDDPLIERRIDLLSEFNRKGRVAERKYSKVPHPSFPVALSLRASNDPSKLARALLQEGGPIGLKRARVRRAPPVV